MFNDALDKPIGNQSIDAIYFLHVIKNLIELTCSLSCLTLSKKAHIFFLLAILHTVVCNYNSNRKMKRCCENMILFEDPDFPLDDSDDNVSLLFIFIKFILFLIFYINFNEQFLIFIF